MEAVIPDIAEVVVSDQLEVLDAFAGHSDDVEDRNAVRLGAHDAVDRRQFAHPIGGGQDRRAADAGVAVGGVGGIEFVGAGHPLQTADDLDGVVHREGIVAGNPEDLVDAEG